MTNKNSWLRNNWIIVLTVGWLVAGIILLLIYLALYKAVDWQVLTGFATWVLAGSVGAAIWQIQDARRRTKAQLEQMERNTHDQLAEVRRSTNAQIAVGLFRELRDEKMVEILRSIYDLKPRESESLQDPEKKRTEGEKKVAKDIDYVLDRFDTLGVLVANKLVDKQLAIEVYAGISALRCWYVLHKYIKGQREIRGYYAENYQAFAGLSLDYFEKARIKPKFYRKDESGKVTEVIDLVNKLQEAEFHPRSLKEIEKGRKKGEV